MDIPFRLNNEKEVVDLIIGEVTDKTVLAMIDTVTSATGLRIPFEKLVQDIKCPA